MPNMGKIWHNSSTPKNPGLISYASLKIGENHIDIYMYLQTGSPWELKCISGYIFCKDIFFKNYITGQNFKKSVEITEDTVRDHNKLQKQIADQKKELEGIENSMANADEKTATLRARWLPVLEKEIKKVSERLLANFKRIQCEGRIELSVPEREDDYKNYGLVIKARYREGSALQEVTTNRHSGGERSVAAMLFLLSMPTKNCPFRLVDEINQVKRTGDQFWRWTGRPRIFWCFLGRAIIFKKKTLGKNWTGDKTHFWWTGDLELSSVLLYGRGVYIFAFFLRTQKNPGYVSFVDNNLCYQGMDQYNERNVLKVVKELTDDSPVEDLCQFFIISPKVNIIVNVAILEQIALLARNRSFTHVEFQSTLKLRIRNFQTILKYSDNLKIFRRF